MSIYKRKNSKFYYCEVAINGKVVIRSTKTTRKSLAARFESLLREQLYRQHVLGELPAIAISDAIHGYSAAKQVEISPRNLRTQVKSLKDQLSRVVPLNRELHTLNSAHLANLAVLRREDGVAEGTIRLLLATLKGVVEWSSAAGYLPPASLSYPKTTVRNHRTRVLNESEETRLLNVLQADSASCDGYDLVILLLDTGARLNEIQQLEWENVDLQRREIRLWRSKTKTESVLKLTDRAFDVLQRRYQQVPACNLLFPSKTGGLRYTTPKSVQAAYKAAGLDRFCTHSLRHTTATRLVKNGMSLFAVSKFLGHANIAMSERYSHLEHIAVADEAARILDKANQN